MVLICSSTSSHYLWDSRLIDSFAYLTQIYWSRFTHTTLVWGVMCIFKKILSHFSVHFPDFSHVLIIFWLLIPFIFFEKIFAYREVLKFLKIIWSQYETTFPIFIVILYFRVFFLFYEWRQHTCKIYKEINTRWWIFIST